MKLGGDLGAMNASIKAEAADTSGARAAKLGFGDQVRAAALGCFSDLKWNRLWPLACCSIHAMRFLRHRTATGS